jgi:hypothetical protein
VHSPTRFGMPRNDKSPKAPSCHPHGNAVIDELARCLRVTRAFHGHRHDDLSGECANIRRAWASTPGQWPAAASSRAWAKQF